MKKVQFTDPPKTCASDSTVKLKFAIISNIWIKMITFDKAGDIMYGHKHVFDHPTLLSQGSVRVTVTDNSGVDTTTDFTAPAIIFIERGKIHTLVSLEDNTVASCIHALRDGDSTEDIIEEDMIPVGTDAFHVFNNYEQLKRVVTIPVESNDPKLNKVL